MTCPSCNKSRIVHNPAKCHNRTAGAVGRSMRGHGHPVVGSIMIAAGVGASVYNFFTPKWKCEDCKHTFNS